VPEPITAEQLIAQMDEIGVRRAVILSIAYVFANPRNPPEPDEYAKVRTENDWTAREAARFPDRLVAFCGVSPLEDYAAAEMERCVRELGMRGLKLHFSNSGVDVRNPEHVRKMREVFRAANTLRIPIVAHLRTRDPSYGREHSRIFLEQILPEAPDVVVQVAHMTDAGPGYTTDAALEPLAEAVAAGDPRTRNLYFDVTTNVTFATSAADAALLARRIRQIGPERILFGSDGAWGGNPPLRQAWGAFHGMLPLTEDEFRVIARNVAPYLR
jgi:predicted TIM-barrel fold metal-dependent hydrolase